MRRPARSATLPTSPTGQISPRHVPLHRPTCATSPVRGRVLGGILGTLLACAALQPHTAQAAESAPVVSPYSTASLITDTATASANAPLHAALRLQLKPGWHTYWRNPGDAGDPVTLNVTASGALEGASQTITWPTPQRIRDASLMSYAYTGDVVLPVTLQLHQGTTTPGTYGRTTLNAQASWLVCEQSCIPQEGTFTLSLPMGAPLASAQASLFVQAAQHTPVPSPYPVTLSPPAVLHVNAPELNAQSVADAWFMPSERGQIAEAAPQELGFDANGLSLRLPPTAGFASGQPLSGILVLRDPNGAERALSVQATVQSGATPVSTSPLPSTAQPAPSPTAQNTPALTSTAGGALPTDMAPQKDQPPGYTSTQSGGGGGGPPPTPAPHPPLGGWRGGGGRVYQLPSVFATRGHY
ncbi:MAG: protein-disulfide reductase DsbD domain-containing protein, partial [Acetobacter sp.]